MIGCLLKKCESLKTHAYVWVNSVLNSRSVEFFGILVESDEPPELQPCIWHLNCVAFMWCIKCLIQT